MVDLKNKLVNLRNNEGKIAGFETWWASPKGLIADLDDAIKIMEEAGYPLEVLRPVTVAICENGVYEVMT